MDKFVNKVFQMDNLELMKQIPDNSIDLIYCDILYGTGRDFGDYKDIKANRDEVEEFYIPRIKEMHRILNGTGSIYLHMDWRINHWIRCIMDDIFGYKNFKNNIVWCYRSQGFNRRQWSNKHDDILFYTKGSDWTFNLDDVREDEIAESTWKRWHKEIEEYGKIPTKKNGKLYWNNPYSPPRDWFDINIVAPVHSERVDYQTQKPKELIEKIIIASSNKGDVVADFFCGSGTTPVVAKELGRKYIACDIEEKAVNITKNRLEEIK